MPPWIFIYCPPLAAVPFSTNYRCNSGVEIIVRIALFKLIYVLGILFY